MAFRSLLDRRAAPIPRIRADGDSVTFHLDVSHVRQGIGVVVRCDSAGDVWAALLDRPKSPECGAESSAPSPE
jgi:hypothetical protein